MENICTDVPRTVQHVIRCLSDVCSNASSSAITLSKGQISIRTKLQLLHGLKFSDPFSSSMYELIVDHATRAEMVGPGGFDRCLMRLLEKLKQRVDGITIDPLQVTLDAIVGDGAAASSMDDLQWVIKAYSPNLSCRNAGMLLVAIELAGFAGKIMIERTSTMKSSVELIRGYTFQLKSSWKVEARYRHAKIICIDGFVEAVSEIHHLLEEASSAKETVLLFTRGMHEDVLNTLKVNFDRGSLRVIPFTVKLDIDGLNTLKDIAVVSSCDVVSSLKGELISSIKLHEMKVVDEVVLHDGQVVIGNSSSAAGVSIVIADMRKRRQEMKHDDLAAMMDGRIRSLSPNHVVIRIADDKDFIVNSQSIDYALRAVKALVEHGTLCIDGEKELTSTVLGSEIYSQRCMDMISSLGAIVR